MTAWLIKNTCIALSKSLSDVRKDIDAAAQQHARLEQMLMKERVGELENSVKRLEQRVYRD
jgi:HAMP domain-containing protein